MSLPYGLILLVAVCICTASSGSILEMISLSLATADTFRALRESWPNGRRVGVSTRRRAMKEALISWIVSVAVKSVDPIFARIFGWLPFYSPLRWLISLLFFFVRRPAIDFADLTQQASTAIYNSLLRPLLKKYELPIDLLLLLFHSISAIVIYHSFTHPVLQVKSVFTTIRGVLFHQSQKSGQVGSQATQRVVDDADKDELRPPTPEVEADVTLSTPHVPGRLLRSARKPITNKRTSQPISRYQPGESSSAAQRHTLTVDEVFFERNSPSEDKTCTTASLATQESTENQTVTHPSQSRSHKRKVDADPDLGRQTDAAPTYGQPRSRARIRNPTQPAESRYSAPTSPASSALRTASTSRAAVRDGGVETKVTMQDSVQQGASKLYPSLPDPAPIHIPSYSSTRVDPSGRTVSTVLAPTNPKTDPFPSHSTSRQNPVPAPQTNLPPLARPTRKLGPPSRSLASSSLLPPSRAKRPLPPPKSSKLQVHPDVPAGSSRPAPSKSSSVGSSSSSGSKGPEAVVNRPSGSRTREMVPEGKSVAVKSAGVRADSEIVRSGPENPSAVVGQKRRAVGDVVGEKRGAGPVKRQRRGDPAEASAEVDSGLSGPRREGAGGGKEEVVFDAPSLGRPTRAPRRGPKETDSVTLRTRATRSSRP